MFPDCIIYKKAVYVLGVFWLSYPIYPFNEKRRKLHLLDFVMIIIEFYKGLSLEL